MLELPRFRLFDGPSPLHRLPRFSAALGDRADVWVKREDLLPLAFGGNKLRNLEFLVGAALAEGADTLITSGRRWSNHCRLTAAAGALAGLAVELVLSGPPLAPPGHGVRLMTSLGATVHQLPTADRTAREAEIDRLTSACRAAGGRPYVIAVGGSGPLGAYGHVLAMGEALSQAAAAGMRPDVVVLPSATGGTQAGLLVGSSLVGSSLVGSSLVGSSLVGAGPGDLPGAMPGDPIAIHGVLVARPEAELRPAIEAVMAPLRTLAGATRPTGDVHLDGSQIGEGYGRPTGAAAEAADLLARTEGILVDPIYTAKALAGLVSAVRGGQHDGQSLLFWHAGGLPGIFETLD